LLTCSNQPAEGSSGTITDSGWGIVYYGGGTEYNFRRVAIPSDNNAYILGSETTVGGGVQSFLLRSTNGGSNWSKINSFPGVDFEDIDFVDDSTGWLVGANGTVYKMLSYGQSFTSISHQITDRLKAVDFTDHNHGAIGGLNGVLFVTFDGGITFQNSNHPNQGVAGSVITDIFFSNELDGYAVGHCTSCPQTQILLKTTDGGLNWTDHAGDFPFQGFLDGLRTIVVSPYTGVAFLGIQNGEIYLGDTGLSSWTSMTINNSPVAQDIVSIQFSSMLEGFALSRSGVVLSTRNSGQSWERDYLYGGAVTFNHLVMLHADMAIAVGNKNLIIIHH